jgi:hypothetical protein
MNDHDETLQPERIQSDIAHTRAEVSSTIDAIQRKLTPGQLMDQAVDYFRSSAPADFGANLGRSVRENPVPVALIGVGIAWLMMSGQGGMGRRYPRNEQYGGLSPEALGESSGEGTMHRAASAVGEAGRKVKDKVSEMTSRAGEMMSSARERISESASGTRMHMSELGGRMGELSGHTREQMYRARGTLTHVLEEQPLVIGAIGVAVGAVLGASLPSTRREDQMMGGTRDELMHSARDAVGEQAEAVKESAGRIAETARQEASRHGQQAGMTSSYNEDVSGIRTESGAGERAGAPAESSQQVLRPSPSPTPGSRT